MNEMTYQIMFFNDVIDCCWFMIDFDSLSSNSSFLRKITKGSKKERTERMEEKKEEQKKTKK